MAAGEMQTLGVSTNLKHRFGAGYMFSLTVSQDAATSEQQIQDYVSSLFPSAKLLQEPIGGKFKYEVAREDVVLSKVFEKVEADKKKLGVVDWGITETTLEEVFLKLAMLSHNDSLPLGRSLSDLARHGVEGRADKSGASQLAVNSGSAESKV